MTLTQRIQSIGTSISSSLALILQSLQGKGATVTGNEKLSEVPAVVDTITGGGGECTPAIVTPAIGRIALDNAVGGGGPGQDMMLDIAPKNVSGIEVASVPVIDVTEI